MTHVTNDRFTLPHTIVKCSNYDICVYEYTHLLQYVACVAVCCSVLQCVAVCCSVLQCVANGIILPHTIAKYTKCDI